MADNLRFDPVTLFERAFVIPVLFLGVICVPVILGLACLILAIGLIDWLSGYIGALIVLGLAILALYLIESAIDYLHLLGIFDYFHMRLPPEVMLLIMEDMATVLSLEEIFEARLTCKMFEEHLTKLILQSERIETEGFGCGRPYAPYNRIGIDWKTFPGSLQMRYLRLKLSNHGKKPTLFSTWMKEMLALPLDEENFDSVADLEERLLHGVRAVEGIDQRIFSRDPQTVSVPFPQPMDPIAYSRTILLFSAAVVQRDLTDFRQRIRQLKPFFAFAVCRRFDLQALTVAAQIGNAEIAAEVVDFTIRLNPLMQGTITWALRRSIYHAAMENNKPFLEVFCGLLTDVPWDQIKSRGLDEAIRDLIKAGNNEMVNFLLDHSTTEGQERRHTTEALKTAVLDSRVSTIASIFARLSFAWGRIDQRTRERLLRITCFSQTPYDAAQRAAILNLLLGSDIRASFDMYGRVRSIAMDPELVQEAREAYREIDFLFVPDTQSV
ncbi:hypothetical protein BJX61DRAFT_546604 [Aspergillus egyptiacus]|nr:hypothetical protein BJX61DRAFT_546604 [Aspergillus egyptiacus]